MNSSSIIELSVSEITWLLLGIVLILGKCILGECIQIWMTERQDDFSVTALHVNKCSEHVDSFTSLNFIIDKLMSNSSQISFV